MPREVTLNEPAIYNEATGELEPLPSGFRVLDRGTVLAVDDRGDVPAQWLDAVAWKPWHPGHGAGLRRLPRGGTP